VITAAGRVLGITSSEPSPRLEAPKPRGNFTAWENTRSVRMNASG
jgi:hypothetical protein